MNSSFERSTLLAGLLVLTFSLCFGFGIAGAWLALPGALFLGAIAMALWLHLDLPASRPWVPPLMIAGAVLLSSIVIELAFRAEFAGWFSFGLAGLGSGAVMFFTVRNRARCNLCNRRLAAQDLTFRCPRCSQQVCEETCWNFEHRRCELCLEQRVPILPIETSWWLRVAGPHSPQGRCQICLTAADHADLRACPKCRRLQCRDCWDFSNGECDRCGAALPELPAALAAVIHSGLHSP